MVIATDMLKMVLSVLIAWGIFTVVMPMGEKPPLFIKYWAGVFCVLGHVFPCTLHFRGGKGILAGGTLALLVDWRVALIAWGLFFLGVLLTRWKKKPQANSATRQSTSRARVPPARMPLPPRDRKSVV